MGSFQTELERIYADRRRAGWSCFWRLAGWFAGAAEIWLCLWFLGVPARWTDAVILESLSQAGRSAAFTVPGAIGVQEAGIIALGLVLGLDPSTALALGLIRRARDLALGLPALAVWSAIEARRQIGALIDVKSETLRGWIERAEIDAGQRPGTSSDEHTELVRLRREVAELRRANEILRTASAFFAAAELDRRLK